MTAEGALSAAMDTPRTFTRLGVRFNAAAFGPELKQGVKLVADLSATRASPGESYSVVLSGETKPLLALLAAMLTACQEAGASRATSAIARFKPFAPVGGTIWAASPARNNRPKRMGVCT